MDERKMPQGLVQAVVRAEVIANELIPELVEKWVKHYQSLPTQHPEIASLIKSHPDRVREVIRRTLFEYYESPEVFVSRRNKK
tara:strand:+ start:392 stop:640 length:249 start_codon:yes stop_codon:yes gene_type:complete